MVSRMTDLEMELHRAEMHLRDHELDYPTHESRIDTAYARGYRDGVRLVVEALRREPGPAIVSGWWVQP